MTDDELRRIAELENEESRNRMALIPAGACVVFLFILALAVFLSGGAAQACGDGVYPPPPPTLSISLP